MAFKLNFENKKQIATILLAVGLGLMGVFLMSIHVENSIRTQTQELAKDYQKRAATTQTALSQELQARDTKIRDLMQKMEARQKAQMDKIAQQAVQAARATGPGAQSATKKIIDNTRFSLLTPSGKRALTVVIDSLSAVGGLISAGDYVDILADLKVPDKKGETKDVTAILFQNVEVLAVGSNFSPESNIATYQQQQAMRSLDVTLAVDPEEVGLVAFAQKYGKLKLALRSPSEKDIKTVDVAAWNSLSDYVLEKQGTKLDVPQEKKSTTKTTAKEPEMEEKASNFVEIYRGGHAL